MNEESKWLLCPMCHGKTRVKIREDTVLHNFLPWPADAALNFRNR